RPLGGAGGEVVHPEVVGAGGGNRGAGDARRQVGKGAVVVVELDDGGPVGGEQRELAVVAAPRREGGHRRGVDAISRVRSEGVVVDVAAGIQVGAHHQIGARQRRG